LGFSQLSLLGSRLLLFSQIAFILSTRVATSAPASSLSAMLLIAISLERSAYLRPPSFQTRTGMPGTNSPFSTVAFT
jgi:hypothetical protein